MVHEFNTVLIIDDERDTLALLRLALKSAQYQVLIAASWGEVGERIKEIYQAGRDIDVIVLDLMMPDRSGFDILSSLDDELYPMPHVVILTAVTGFAKQVKARELGASRYLTKPTTPKKLIETIEAVLAEAKK